MYLNQFPRVNLAHLPTVIENMPNLSAGLNVNQLFIKRDDCTGLAGGGNKTRKLEFLIADALHQKADCVITQGAVQSNHVRQTAAACAKFNLACYAILERRVRDTMESYENNGNVLLDRLFNTILSYVDANTNMNAAMQALASDLKSKGKNPYIIPGGGSNCIGALGYVNCMQEILYQINSQKLKIDAIVHATGSTGTQAGLVAGQAIMNNWNIPIIGISVRAEKTAQEANVFKLANETAGLFNASVKPEQVIANSDYVGEGYGIANQETIDTIHKVAQTEGILLDPVYSAKGMNGCLDLCNNGFFSKKDNILFIHTGGAQALFGYPQLIE